MSIKVENRSTIAIKHLEKQIERAFDCVPAEHSRGFTRIVIVDRIDDPRHPKDQVVELPFLYHPRIPGMPSAFGEIALATLFPANESWYRRVVRRMQARPLLAQAVLSLAAQHYLITISSRKKKGSGIERAVREYLDKYFRIWRERNGGWRAKVFKPLLPYLEKWQKSARRYMAEQARKKAEGR
jgi:hypothetical protein